MPQLSRKVLTIILAVLLIAALGIGAFIVIRLQANQAPVNSSATGFGPGATRNLFQKVYDNFKAKTCTDILTAADIQKLTATALGNPAAFKGSNITDYGSDPITPKFCDYAFSSTSHFLFTLNDYNQTSVITNNAQEEYDRTNNNLILEVIKTDTIGSVKYFYGSSLPGAQGVCQVTMFQQDNDFDYAAVTYYGVSACTDPDMIDFNTQLMQTLAAHIGQIMDDFYAGLTTKTTP